jgi:endonuclease/exonuclease/phosphatase family metal-dependent hydrolase
VRRAVIVASIKDGESPFFAIGVHGAHLTHGSLIQFRHVSTRLDELGRQRPIVVGGDFNCWRPLLRVVLPNWKSGVKAKTWPSWRAHSQIDHLLLRGNWQISHRASGRGPSDHRPLIMDASQH